MWRTTRSWNHFCLILLENRRNTGTTRSLQTFFWIFPTFSSLISLHYSRFGSLRFSPRAVTSSAQPPHLGPRPSLQTPRPFARFVLFLSKSRSILPSKKFSNNANYSREKKTKAHSKSALFSESSPFKSIWPIFSRQADK